MENAYERLGGLGPYRRVEVERLVGEAIGYVWGYQDATGAKDSEQAFEFMKAYRAHALDYAEEKRCSRHSIQDAFESWVKTGAIS